MGRETIVNRFDEHIERIARWIVESDHVVAFTGAGISTSSGIPDFLFPDGRFAFSREGVDWRLLRERGYASLEL